MRMGAKARNFRKEGGCRKSWSQEPRGSEVFAAKENAGLGQGSCWPGPGNGALLAGGQNDILERWALRRGLSEKLGPKGSTAGTGAEKKRDCTGEKGGTGKRDK